jgi:hypothetical protein
MMHTAKRKLLDKAGWRVGSSEEFLGLTKEESALVEMKLALAGKVKALRAKHRISQRRLLRG